MVLNISTIILCKSRINLKILFDNRLAQLQQHIKISLFKQFYYIFHIVLFFLLSQTPVLNIDKVRNQAEIYHSFEFNGFFVMLAILSQSRICIAAQLSRAIFTLLQIVINSFSLYSFFKSKLNFNTKVFSFYLMRFTCFD